MSLDTHEKNELAHLKNLVTHRTKPDGSPSLGYKANVEMLRREIAKLEAKANV